MNRAVLCLSGKNISLTTSVADFTFYIANFAIMQTVQVQIVNTSSNPLPEYATAGSAGMAQSLAKAAIATSMKEVMKVSLKVI